MQQRHAQLLSLLEPSVSTLGCELWGIEMEPQGNGNLLRIYIDAEQGVTIEDCQRVSQQVSAVLDVEDAVRGHYVLEVSSPGLNRPLFNEAQFQRFKGERVRLRLDVPVEGRRRIIGSVQHCTDGRLTIVDADGKNWELSLDDVGAAHLDPKIEIA